MGGVTMLLSRGGWCDFEARWWWWWWWWWMVERVREIKIREREVRNIFILF